MQNLAETLLGKIGNLLPLVFRRSDKAGRAIWGVSFGPHAGEVSRKFLAFYRRLRSLASILASN